MRRDGFLLLLLVVLSIPAAALEFLSEDAAGTKGPEILSRAVGARNLALGGTGVPMANDASALFWNPAWMNSLERAEGLFAHENGFAGETLDTLAWVKPVWWRKKRRTWGAGLAYLTQNSFDVKVDEESLGTAKPYDLVGGLSYAQPWGRGAMGVTAKYVRQQLFSTSAQAFALDAGAAASGDGWRLGGAIANVGTRLKGDSESIGLPLAIKGGAAMKLPVGAKNQLWLAIQADAPADDSLVSHVGLEYMPAIPGRWEAALRAGYQDNGIEEGFSAGFGLRRDSWGINYAFQTRDELGDAHRIDLFLRFGSPLEQEVRRQSLLAQAGNAISAGRLMEARGHLEALEYFTRGDAAVAGIRRDLERALSESIDPQTLFLQGQEYFGKGDYRTSLELFERLRVVDPAYPGAAEWLSKSRAQVEAERSARTRQEVARAKERERPIRKKEAQEAENAGRWEDAVQAWRRVVELSPSDNEARVGLVRCRAALLEASSAAETAGNWELALAKAKAALTAGELNKETSERVARLERLWQDDKRQRAQAKYGEGAEAYRAQEWQKARRLFREALELAPDSQVYRKALERLNAERTEP